MSETLDLCQALIKIPSFGSADGESGIIDYIRRYLEDICATDIRIVAGQASRPNLICEIVSGEPGPTLIIFCHVDVFGPESERWTIDPLKPELRNGELWGAGASDAKGGVAAMLVAARRLRANGGPIAGKLVLAFTADEDCDGKWGVPWLVQNGHIQGDAAISLTPAGMVKDYDGLPLAARGFINANVRVNVPQRGYAWQYRPEQPHAVALAARLLTAIEMEFRPEPATQPLFPGGPTVVAGSTISGGEFAGVLAETAQFSLESRLLPGTDADKFITQLKTFVDSRSGEADVQVELADVWFGGYADGCNLEPDHPIAIAALEAVRACGYDDIQFTGSPLFCEGALVSALGIPTLPALGPGRVSFAHNPDERASVESIERCTEVLATLIDKILVPKSILNAQAY